MEVIVGLNDINYFLKEICRLKEEIEGDNEYAEMMRFLYDVFISEIKEEFQIYGYLTREIIFECIGSAVEEVIEIDQFRNADAYEKFEESIVSLLNVLNKKRFFDNADFGN